MAAHQDFKTVDGKKLTKSQCAYAPSDDPEDWKLPVDSEHVEAALDMFAHAQIPEGAKREVAQRIASAAAEHGADKEKIESFKKRHLTVQADAHGRIVVVLDGRPGLRLESARAGAANFEMPLAVTGSWVKNGQHFSITGADLKDIVDNFEKRKNGMVEIDYEHASEMAELARGGPVPSSATKGIS